MDSFILGLEWSPRHLLHIHHYRHCHPPTIATAKRLKMRFLSATVALVCVIASSTAIVTRDLPFTDPVLDLYKDNQKTYSYCGVSRCEFPKATSPTSSSCKDCQLALRGRYLQRPATTAPAATTASPTQRSTT